MGRAVTVTAVPAAFTNGGHEQTMGEVIQWRGQCEGLASFIFVERKSICFFVCLFFTVQTHELIGKKRDVIKAGCFHCTIFQTLLSPGPEHKHSKAAVMSEAETKRALTSVGS